MKRYSWSTDFMEWCDDGDYVLFSDHEAEIARLRAEASGQAESFADALECEKDYLLEISELRAEVEENEKAMNVWRGRTQRAEAEAEAYRKDAERYRWLRNADNYPSPIGGFWNCLGETSETEEMDEYIDAAMGASA